MATLLPLSSFPASAFTPSYTLLKRLSSLRQPPTSLFHSPLRPSLAASATSLSPSSPAPEFDSPMPSAVQSFWKWLIDEGVVSSKSLVEPAIVPEGLGLVARRNIGRNEVVMEVPKRLWINPDAVAASEIGNVCSGLKSWVSLALFLIRERSRVDSTWRFYLNTLPDHTDSTIYWSEEELSEIQGTQLLSTTLGVKEFIESEFSRVKEAIILPHKQLFPSLITVDDFFWAFGTLRSRAFSRVGQDLNLIPLADLLNHCPSIIAEEYAWEIKGAGLFSRDLLFSLKNPVSVKAGDQVLIQYDIKKSNADLALDYGFIESRSDRHSYTLSLEIPESDPFYGDKLDIAESNGLRETEDFDIVSNCPLPPAMLPYLRLVALGGQDAFLLESIFRNKIWGHLELPVSRTNEGFICKAVRDACRLALDGYHTTIEEDEKMKKGGTLHPRLEIAVGIRQAEKKVLQQIDGAFRDRELELDMLEYYQERRLRDLGLVGEQGDIIFWESK